MLSRRLCSLAVRLLIAFTLFLPFSQKLSAQAEDSLEAEFQLQRNRLGALPEYAGSDADSKFRLAEELARRGDVNGAIESYRLAIRLEPDRAEPYRGLGQVFLDHHNYQEAVVALRENIKLGGGDAQSFYWLGRGLMGIGNLTEAERALNQAIERKQDDAEAFADLALVLMARGDSAGAQAALTRSIKLTPDNADSHRLRDQLKKAGGDPQKTRQAGLRNLHELFGRE